MFSFPSSLHPSVHAYVIDFSNILNKTSIERLASADEFEVVREVQVRAPPCPATRVA